MKSSLEEKLAQLATTLAQRTDGIVYLPLYRRLEEELARGEGGQKLERLRTAAAFLPLDHPDDLRLGKTALSHLFAPLKL
ncbi:MAG: hypothetical protein N4A53_03090 [Pelagimonas sp.]|nr:hypothetical protein [Pelagimonas sp.]